MPITPVTMWQVSCDHPAGCDVSQANDDDGFVAWTDRASAIEVWQASDGVVRDGKAYCHEHIPDEVRLSNADVTPLLFDATGEGA